MKAETDDTYAIFFIEEECQKQYYHNNTKVSTYNSTRVIQGVEDSNVIS